MCVRLQSLKYLIANYMTLSKYNSEQFVKTALRSFLFDLFKCPKEEKLRIQLFYVIYQEKLYGIDNKFTCWFRDAFLTVNSKAFNHLNNEIFNQSFHKKKLIYRKVFRFPAFN